MNSSQAAIAFEEAVKAKLRDYTIRKFVGFDAVYVSRSTKYLHVRCAVTAIEVQNAGWDQGFKASRATVEECMEMIRMDYFHPDYPNTYVPYHHLVVKWLEEVHESLERQGYPFMNNEQQMADAYAKAKEKRDARKR